MDATIYPNAEIIAVGSELLTPQRVDTDSLYLTGKLNHLGVEVVRKSIVGDPAVFYTESTPTARVPGLGAFAAELSASPPQFNVIAHRHDIVKEG